MIGTMCPYCRGTIDEGASDLLTCEGCGTQHHADCYAENGGCTVFGCRCSPPEEAKVSIAAPELAYSPATDVVRPYGPPSAPPPPPPGGSLPSEPQPAAEPTVEELGASVVPSIFSSYPSEAPEPVHEPKSRTSFILLGALLGAFGAHSFYAGYKKKGWIQLAITVLSLGFAGPMTWIWAIIDICTLDHDNYGVHFTA